MKYVEVDGCWQEDETNEECVGEEGLHPPHGVRAMPDLIPAGMGR